MRFSRAGRAHNAKRRQVIRHSVPMADSAPREGAGRRRAEAKTSLQILHFRLVPRDRDPKVALVPPPFHLTQAPWPGRPGGPFFTRGQLAAIAPGAARPARSLVTLRTASALLSGFRLPCITQDSLNGGV